jgi:hypothetical protein
LTLDDTNDTALINPCGECGKDVGTHGWFCGGCLTRRVDRALRERDEARAHCAKLDRDVTILAGDLDEARELVADLLYWAPTKEYKASLLKAHPWLADENAP